MDWQNIPLNAAQREAVTTTEGFVRVIAGAGSGKTRALAYRFAYLVEELGILPSRILCVTFTNKSAAEMRRRIHNLTGDRDTGYINTFHGFCVSVLQEDGHAAQYPKNFLVLDNSDVDSMLKIVYEERGLTLRDMTFAKARDMIETRKLFTEPEYYLDMVRMSIEPLRAKYERAVEAADVVFYGYLYQQKKCFGLDYNDLIKFTLYIFEQSEAIRRKWQARLEYIMIDEFQDIDSLQYRLMEVLCAYHKNLFVVGDPDQTIYTWRGADVRYLNEFDAVFPNVKTVMMMQNYRSTPEILAVANSLIAANAHRIAKELIPTREAGEAVVCRYAADAEEEAGYLAEEIAALYARGVPYREIAVLYRAHYVTRAIEEAFLRAQIPYQIYSGVQFFDRAEIKDALSYLRLIAYRDDLSFLRVVNVPKRNVGDRRIRFLKDYAETNACPLYTALARNLEGELFVGTGAAQFVESVERWSEDYAKRPISELLSAILDESGYERMLRTEGSGERLDNLAELKQSVYEYVMSCGEECTLEHYLSHVALFANGDISDSRDRVRLMTVHAAKGLEFPYVFLCEMNEGVFPTKRTATVQAMEEERRLAFVALTRAERKLVLTEAQGRSFDGTPRYPSRFLLDVDPALLRVDPPPREDLIAATREYIAFQSGRLADPARPPAFGVGSRVRHGVFGTGTVLEADRERAAYAIRFDGTATPRTVSFRAKLLPE